MKLVKAVSEFIAVKQSVGNDYGTQARQLRSFCKAMGNVSLSEVKPKMVMAFLTRTPFAHFAHTSFYILRIFYEFVVSRGYARRSPLPLIIPKQQPFFPYIYSVEELRKLLVEADRMTLSTTPLRRLLFRTLLLTFYSTGIRVGEALSLTTKDVNLAERLLLIRESKFYKTRLVPFGPQLAAVLAIYREERRRLPSPQGEDSNFFCSRVGGRIPRSNINTPFRVLCQRAGIRREGHSHFQPRLHDLRHTFAVRRLETWYREGADVQQLLPHLSTYLGHINIAGTQRYLTMTPELLTEANRRFERYALSEVHHV